MGQVFDEITDKVKAFVERQPMFFVGSAPLSGEGHINLSPKGLDTFKVLGPREVAYLDLGGSGIETVAHVKENGRIVLMFCAFDGSPKIIRFHGRGTVYEAGSPEFEAYAKQFPQHVGVRSYIHVDVTRIADSCGWGVPLMEFQEHRKQHPEFVKRMTPEMIEAAMEQNAVSLDGLTGLSRA